MRKSIACWYSGESGFINRVVPVLIVALGAVCVPQAAFAQVFIADGTTITVSGDAITHLEALNGGVINSFTPLGIIGGSLNPVVATTGGRINIFQGSTINSVGDALVADGAGSTITITGTSVTGSAAGADVSGGATINILSGSMVTTPLSVLENEGTLNISGSTLISETGLVGFGAGINTINLTGSTVTATQGGLPDPFIQGAALEVAGGGTTTLNAGASHITGAMVTDSTSTSIVHLTNGTVWEMTGSSNLTTLTNVASTIDFSPPTGDPTLLSSYKTLTANSYAGQGGIIGLNTFLGTDGSPSDRLVINGGTASGTTLLRIINTGGSGATTHGNGILVVDATNGGTEAGAFALVGEVRAGASDYDLFRGAVDGNDFQSWFLRSDFIVPPPGNGNGNGFAGGNGPGNGNGNGNGNGGVVELPGGGEEFPADPPPAVLPPGTYPIIGPELATYGVVQPIARQMGLTTLGTLHERVGDAAADAACLNASFDIRSVTRAPPVPDNCRQVVWGRLFGQQIDNRYEAFADPRATGQVAGIQAGADLWRGSLIPGHSDAAGLYFGYSNGNVSVDGLLTNAVATAYMLEHTGSVNLNAYSVGGYWTHYGPTGWYIDAVLQGSFYNGNAATQFARLSTNGTGFISSLEAGYPIQLPWFGPRFVLEPEAQMLWQQVSFRDDNDGLGSVGLGTTSGASGRLGLRGRWTIDDPAGRVWQPYVLANVWRDWGAEATTTFGLDQVPLVQHATRVELAAGLSAKILPGLSLYAQAGYQFAPSSDLRRDGVKGDFGVRFAW